MATAARFALEVNGRAVAVTAPPETPLAMALRNQLGLRGTRLGCEQGSCGACTVVVDGQAVRSCDTTIEAAAGRSVVTIDHLAQDPPHPLVEALLAADAGQCCFCLAGIVMATLPMYGSHVGRGEIAAAIDGNLCRCGAHGRILKALETALAEAAP